MPADEEAEGDGEHADDERDAGAEHGPAEDVVAVAVGAEPARSLRRAGQASLSGWAQNAQTGGRSILSGVPFTWVLHSSGFEYWLHECFT